MEQEVTLSNLAEYAGDRTELFTKLSTVLCPPF